MSQCKGFTHHTFIPYLLLFETYTVVMNSYKLWFPTWRVFWKQLILNFNKKTFFWTFNSSLLVNRCPSWHCYYYYPILCIYNVLLCIFLFFNYSITFYFIQPTFSQEGGDIIIKLIFIFLFYLDDFYKLSHLPLGF